MYCIIKCIVQGKQARVKNADLRHPSCTVVIKKRKSASPVLNVLRCSFSLTYTLSWYSPVYSANPLSHAMAVAVLWSVMLRCAYMLVSVSAGSFLEGNVSIVECG